MSSVKAQQQQQKQLEARSAHRLLYCKLMCTRKCKRASPVAAAAGAHAGVGAREMRGERGTGGEKEEEAGDRDAAERHETDARAEQQRPRAVRESERLAPRQMPPVAAARVHRATVQTNARAARGREKKRRDETKRRKEKAKRKEEKRRDETKRRDAGR